MRLLGCWAPCLEVIAGQIVYDSPQTHYEITLNYSRRVWKLPLEGILLACVVHPLWRGIIPKHRRCTDTDGWGSIYVRRQSQSWGGWTTTRVREDVNKHLLKSRPTREFKDNLTLITRTTVVILQTLHFYNWIGHFEYEKNYNFVTVLVLKVFKS